MRLLSLLAAATGGLLLSHGHLSANDEQPSPTISVPEAMLSLSASDIQRSMERLRSGIYGQLYALPLFADIHHAWDAGAEDFTQGTGIDAQTLLAELAAAEVRMSGMDWDNEQPHIQLAVELGTSAAALDMQERSSWSAMDLPDGADAAAQRDNDSFQLVRFGSLLSGRWGHEDPFLRSIADSGEDDLRLTWNAEHIRSAMEPILESLPADMPGVQALYGRYGNAEIRLRFLPDGFQEVIRLSGSDLLMGSLEIDQAVLDRLPADTLLAFSFAIDGAEAHSFITQMMEEMTGDHPDIAADIAEEIDPTLELLKEVRGTTSIAILPPPMGAPFPGLAVQIPWNDALQQPSQEALAMLADGLILPEVGARQNLRLPTPMPLPVPVVAARSDSHLLITTVPSYARSWLAGEGGGYTTSPAFSQALAQHRHGRLTMIGSSDTPRIITLLQNTFDTFGAFAPAEAQEVIAPLLEVLAGHSGQGYLLSSGSDTLIETRSKGLIGSTMLIPLSAGLLLPAITSARERAQSLETMNNARQISMAMFNYTFDHNRMPQPPENVDWPEDPQAITAAMFEELALDQELPYQIFRATNDGSPLSSAPRADLHAIWSNPNLDYAYSFALDWSAPLASPAIRPVLASRHPVDGDRVVVVFGDHSSQLVPISAIHEDGSLVVINPRGRDEDNIFAGDTEHDWSPGGNGPRDRAWLR